MTKTSKNNNKIYKITQISADFLYWLNGIQEDEPLPFEVKHIYFILDFSNNDIALSYTGSEVKQSVFELAFYSPLEGEYFYCDELKRIAHLMFDCRNQNKTSISKTDIFNMLKNVVYDSAKKLHFLKYKHIYFGFLHENITE